MNSCMHLRRLIHRVVVGLFFACSSVSFAFAQSAATVRSAAQNVDTEYTLQDLLKLEQQVQMAIKKVEPAIVAIGNRFGRKNSQQISLEGNRFASGVIISADGLILSQYHVSHQGLVDEDVGLCIYGEPGDKVEVILADGQRKTGLLLGGDRLADISLLKLETPGSYPFATIADSQRVGLGQWTIKLGHPAGYQPRRGPSARLGRVIYANNLNIVTTCRTNGGDSGGPLVDGSGSIVGLVQSSLMPNHVMQLAQQRDSMPLAYMSAGRVREKLELLKSTIVKDTKWTDYHDRQREYEAVTETLPSDACGLGMGVQTAYAPCVQSAARCVVQILAPDKQPIGYGTILSTDGLVLTKASHIQSSAIYRLHNGDFVSASILGSDPSNDLALLKIENAGVVPLRFAVGPVSRGTMVLAPGREQRWDIGIVSAPLHTEAIALELTADGSDALKKTFPSAFEHDVPLEKFMLGGPLLNLQGELVGISIATAGNHGSLALPVESIRRAISQLKQTNLP